MKQIGIIMLGNHSRLVLDGTKTMTRRTRGLERINTTPNDWEAIGVNPSGLWEFRNRHDGLIVRCRCPYQVGDRLIIKETWATENQYNHLKPSEVPRTAKIWYLADEQYNPQIMGKVRSAMLLRGCRR